MDRRRIATALEQIQELGINQEDNPLIEQAKHVCYKMSADQFILEQLKKAVSDCAKIKSRLSQVSNKH